ncbi:putative conserved protein PhnB, glyoxalase superfamily [Streptoalloteichus tenebrarius]|uniref:Conserved protein PhnB, glyoxalase superfamily n=1 Tax=Streptoalloteichus tenebrarius (strain ATCC 17920 / DSM 40477 / JCM 4838 / CBS 697.72 / NBRC 16177 / NCIMB 11028 / NRRL B-12390 / A12253. 1 / ISP 5477) TaxID=1933 RepID=A0ABT1I439_STRSD|nr:VOC family protein [Streptoalloteichus tenebrarius]MCP2262551.1 putative conserved protein PhnB, glyoxalase superfamily [Streptoalloteichus tenebrarius]
MSSLTPYVMAPAKPFTHFIKSVFDAEISHVVPLPMDPERVMHAEARIGTGVLFFADSGAHGEQCQTNPTEPAHIQMWVTVPDPDAVFARAVAAGARSAQEITAQEDGSRMGGFVDPFGTLWWISTRRPGHDSDAVATTE